MKPRSECQETVFPDDVTSPTSADRNQHNKPQLVLLFSTPVKNSPHGIYLRSTWNRQHVLRIKLRQTDCYGRRIKTALQRLTASYYKQGNGLYFLSDFQAFPVICQMITEKSAKPPDADFILLF
jgi:hypothetical protein